MVDPVDPSPRVTRQLPTDDVVERRSQQCVSLSEASLHGFAIRIACKACKYQRTVDTQPLSALFRARRWRDDFISVSNRMRCRRCDKKLCSVGATATKPDSVPIGPTSDQEYHALIKRMRD